MIRLCGTPGLIVSMVHGIYCIVDFKGSVKFFYVTLQKTLFGSKHGSKYMNHFRFVYEIYTIV